MHSWMNRTQLPVFVAIVLIALLSGCTKLPTPAPVEEPTGAPAAQLEAAEADTRQGTVLSAFNTADFAGPSICTVCHLRLIDEAGVDVSMPTEWRSTMMANAAKDPV